jgi:hypothetical protein
MATELEPEIKSSTYRSYQNFVNLEKEIPDIMEKVPAQLESQYNREMEFLAAVDKSKGPIKRTIVSMVRTRINGKEFLYYTETWEAKDWRGADITPIRDRMEGIHKEVLTEPIVDERNRKIGSKFSATKEVYDLEYYEGLPDKLISETGTDKDAIRYHFRNPDLGRRDRCFYSQFVTKTWNQASDILMKDGGFAVDYSEGLNTSKKK